MKKINAVRDSGWKRDLKKITKSRSIDAGLFSAKHDSELIAYGSANEFGTDNIPERSFLRGTVIESKSLIKNFVKNQIKLLITGVINERVFYRSIGLFVQNAVVKRINTSKNWAVPNTPKTIKLKSRNGKVGDQPLVDSGRMKQAVSWRIGGKFI